MNTSKRILRTASLALCAALLAGVVSGCGQSTVQATPTPAYGAINLSFQPDFNKAGEDYTPVEVTPVVADYAVNPDLSNVVNLDQFPNLTAEQKEKLAANGFVAAPGSQEQLFYIYEDNTYKKIPNFVTTDSVLQVYHIFYDYALRSTEGTSLIPEAMTLNENMLAQLQKEYEGITDSAVKAEAMKVLGYFGAAQLAFGGTLPENFPSEVKDLVESEMELVNAADGRHPSPLFGYEIDYSLFTPRGHYTRSDELKQYFLGMSWYGVVPFPLYESDGKTRDTESAMRAIIAATALCRLPESDGGALWENLYSTTSFFVGEADDVTPYQIAEIVQKVYGDNPDLNEIADEGKMDSFYTEAEALPEPQINAKNDLALANGEDVRSGLQMRFMGQRYIPDSEILQELTESVVRPFPTGLDVFAALGSQRAADLIAQIYKPTETWPEYTEHFNSMKEKFTNLSDSTWRSNMYYAWLWTQNSLTGEYGQGYPMFMRNTAWQDKSLATALGSWAEMRHDTILYAKGSAAECGGFDEPPVVRAYVEPNAELYNRLLWLTAYSRENLSARGVLPDNIADTCQRFEEMLTFLRDCSVKELQGEDLTSEEYDSLLTYGGLLESLTSNCTENGYKWFQIESETDRNMAVIADVHTAIPGGYLEEGVGSAAELYVIVPMGGELYLTRGAMFDYYEFVSQERLTDEAWQSMLKTDAPDRPPFVSSFTAGAATEVPAPDEPYSTGC
ncbi:DUF3160 domain-containing protein [Papillibacter cinnamivorans]|uniref:DUF3160 domain-containing protein n=1 Tax=Papillibacter cinnamivorans DSM 12816 TaxID=1122930 RepID=A0A1W1YE11_9FIRM|nr:DUF3160 domain-containing protein [Papillibacter cinnamivorans]SMC34460.1 Protein of unknown function [Papillibacter cinnamivorans DSM 12816]